jgi:hypothetical protein
MMIIASFKKFQKTLEEKNPTMLILPWRRQGILEDPPQ